MKKLLIVVAVVLVIIAVVFVVLFVNRPGQRADHGSGPVSGTYLTDPTSEEQTKTCDGVDQDQPIVRFTKPATITTMTICLPDPDDPAATPFEGPFKPQSIERGASDEEARLLDAWAQGWSGRDDLPLSGPTVCTADFRINPSFSVTTDEGVTVRPVAPYNGCRRATPEADKAFMALLNSVR